MNRVDAGNQTQIVPEELDLSLDQAFSLLASDERRALLTSLLEANRGMFVEELVDSVATRMDSADEESDQQALAISLHHVHLPKLAEADVIEWDREHDHVEPTAALAKLEPFLMVAATFDSSA